MIRKLLFAVISLVFLCSCSPYSVESLFAPPRVPEEYAGLNAVLNEARIAGAEYVYPTAGNYRQAVQLFDLDTDGEDECVVFLRNPAQKPEVQIYLYECTDGKFWLYSVVDGLSGNIESVTYADVLGRGNYELVVGWEQTGKKTIAVYEMTEETFAQHYEMPYQYYTIADLNGDGVGDLNLVDSGTENLGKFSMHSARNGSLTLEAQVLLSVPVTAIERIGAGQSDAGNAIFVTGATEAGFVTDVIAMQGKTLKNLAFENPLLCKYPLYFTDLDGDGTIEIPRSEQDPLALPTALWELTWCDYSESGALREKLYTCYSSEQNWYLSLPLAWKGKIKTEYNNTNGAIAKAKFYTETYTPLFTFAAISGEKREALLAQEGMVRVAESENTVYAVKIEQDQYLGEVLTPEWLGNAFRRKESTWATANFIVK
ncbi:MAG: hypothetical protein IJC88_07015 [Oscillospiraceae bacterium]|nr:hypothetical protein [Oscillospiraceae bacterium]